MSPYGRQWVQAGIHCSDCLTQYLMRGTPSFRGQQPQG
jgi:hypothetical protein